MARHKILPNLGMDYLDLKVRESKKMDKIIVYPGHLGISTLKNLGNTCFFNSVLQSLFHTSELREFFLNGDYTSKSRLVQKVSETFRVMCANNYCISPHTVYEAFAFAKKKFDHDQEDAHEAVQFMIDRLHEGLMIKKFTVWVNNGVRLKSMKEVSPISDIFQTEFCQKTQCTECMHVSKRYPVGNELILNLDDTNEENIYDLLNKYFRRDIMENDEKYHCDDCCKKCQHYRNNLVPNCPICSVDYEITKDNKCSQCVKQMRSEGRECNKTVALKKTKILKLPKCLVIVLGRFKTIWDSRVNNLVQEKNEKMVEFPLIDLDMSPYVESNMNYKYELYSVNYHVGRNTHGGHYFSSAKVESGWIKLDDTIATNIKSLNEVVNNKAYILYYKRV